MSRLDDFLDVLVEYRAASVFNPWAEWDREHDVDRSAPGIRLENLRRYLEERIARAQVVLIAEAPGYQGCKFSGIAMTCERQLMADPDPLFGGPYFDGPKRRTSSIATKPAGMIEPTATIVWNAMLDSGFEGREWVNWNVFAWHPVGSRGSLSNRTPTSEEVLDGVTALHLFLSVFEGLPIATVGKTSERALEALGVETLASLRHPARGGASEFRQGIAQTLTSDARDRKRIGLLAA